MSTKKPLKINELRQYEGFVTGGVAGKPRFGGLVEFLTRMDAGFAGRCAHGDAV